MSLIKTIVARYRYQKNPVGVAREMGVEIGENCRILCGLSAFGSEPYLVRLGNHVTVTGGVQFITHDGGVWIFREEFPQIDVFGRITVGDNVFIGYGAIILPGVVIGSNSIVGAGAVVTRDVPSDTVVAGVPARAIRRRDEYLKSVLAKAHYIRDLPEADKRARLQSLK